MLSAGTRLGPYEVLSALGAGGMGEVYRARDTKLGREVAKRALIALRRDRSLSMRRWPSLNRVAPLVSFVPFVSSGLLPSVL